MSKLVYLERVYICISISRRYKNWTHTAPIEAIGSGSSPGFGAKVWQISSAWSMPKRKIRNMPLGGSGNGWECCESEWLNTFDEWLSDVISISFNGYEWLRWYSSCSCWAMLFLKNWRFGSRPGCGTVWRGRSLELCAYFEYLWYVYNNIIIQLHV